MPKIECPSCRSNKITTFYEVNDVPVNSCMLLSTEHEALTFPKGDILLGFCNTCGFITNTAFEPAKVTYGSIYEDQQCFSSTFNVFAERLAKRLVDKYHLYNKTVLEIGCGKGDFLSLLCELGQNSGFGIDPAHIKGRVVSKQGSRVEFIADYYSSARYGYLRGDFICCRHTLEHIQKVHDFVNEIQTSFQGLTEVVAFFEVPDVTRILGELAFWDIYYEHCSYFTPGSLARLFRSCKFEILDLYNDFDKQYVMIEASPSLDSNSFSKKTHVSEDNIECVKRRVDYFASNHKGRQAQWRKLVKRYRGNGKKVAIWGSGSKCVAFLTTLGITDEIDSIVDINPFRHGKFIPGIGKQILGPNYLKQCKPDLIIVMNPIYLEEIKQQTKTLHIDSEIISL